MADKGNTAVWPRTVAVLGAAGLIGSGVAQLLVAHGECETVYLHDVRADLVTAHAIDMAEAQLAAGSSRTALVPSAEGEHGPVDLVVVAASAPEVPDGDRQKFLAANLGVLHALAPEIERLAGNDGVVLLLTNPVEALAETLRRSTSLAPQRILGYTLNDSFRLRMAVGRELSVHPQSVSAWVLGEHGAGQVPLLSNVRVDGEVRELTSEACQRIRADIDGWFARWSALRPGRSSGWTTPQGTLKVIRAIAEHRALPGSVWTGEVPGLANCFLTLPAIFGPRGLTGIADWPMSNDERTALEAASRKVTHSHFGA
jgi:malate dehydrogenase